MNPHFEIKYLALKWYDKNTLIAVTESMNALRLEYDDKREIFKVETTIYPRLHDIERGQLGIRFLDKKSDTATPYIEMPNGEKNYLDPIKDSDTGITWWIVKDKWMSDQKQWLGIAPNIVGIVRFLIHNKWCEITINGADFTQEQLEQYLRSFKNDLWELILDESSAVSAEAKEAQAIVGVNDEVIECINNLVAHAHKILRIPKVELREIQALKSRKAVKPVNRTFMELSTKIDQRFLTSRATEPSYNIAENRYILFALERCYRIIKRIVILAENKSRRFKDTVKKLQRQYDALTDTVKIDRNMVVSDLEKMREYTKLEYWQKKIDKKINDNNIRLHLPFHFSRVFDIKLGSISKNLKNDKPDGFFILVRDENGNNWIKPQDKSAILSLGHNYPALINIFEFGMVLRIHCDYTEKPTEKSVQFKLRHIHSIKLIDFERIHQIRKSFEKERDKGTDLAANNWIKPLSKQELDEQGKEKTALLNRIQFYKKNQALSSYTYEKIEPKLRAIKKLIKHFKMLNIKPSSYFPNSMTFVQNPHYQGVHNGYKTLRNITNLTDEDLLISLEKIDEIGLINMPLLYERWTFIQIILVLQETFRFIPQDDWKYQLIDALKTNRTDIKINLSNELAKRHISLWYEKKLPNNKRPDFVLDLKWFAEQDLENKDPELKRFVLDAKFYDKNTFDKAGGMMSKVNELYVDKNYSENANNPVFIIHPCRNLIKNRVTSQEWGKHSFLGELDIMGNGKFYSHDRGAIFLNPIDRTLYNDELQRLLGMFIQYKLESSNIPNNQDKDDRTLAVPICIRCGSTHITRLEKSSGYYNLQGKWVIRTSRSVWMKCEKCEQIQSYNHCRSCSDGTRLIKNGLYWSYHSARAFEPFNMKCPSCGEWGIW